MAKIRNEISIDKSAQDVWAILKKFGDNRDWSDMLSNSELQGDIRICTLGENSPAPGAILRERLIGSDDRLMRLEYTVVEAPFPVEFHNALIDVHPTPTGSIVSWTTNVLPDELADMFSPGFDADLASLKTLAEAA